MESLGLGLERSLVYITECKAYVINVLIIRPIRHLLTRHRKTGHVRCEHFRKCVGEIKPRSVTFLFQRLSVAIQRGNAASVTGTSAPSAKLDNIFLFGIVVTVYACSLVVFCMVLGDL